MCSLTHSSDCIDKAQTIMMAILKHLSKIITCSRLTRQPKLINIEEVHADYNNDNVKHMHVQCNQTQWIKSCVDQPIVQTATND